MGLCTREKGLFTTVDAIALANRDRPGAFRLTVAGNFCSAQEERLFHQRAKELPEGSIRHVGFADRDSKHALFTAADVFCFPTFYPHESQPLTLIEALAHDLPIATTRWRGIPSLMPAGSSHIRFVEPDRPSEIAAALLAARHAPGPDGALRRHFLAHYTPERHLASLKAALKAIEARHASTSPAGRA